jgi:predicted RNA-binding Zn-ribbon protein involved in translation (DUF1610 family)
MMKKQENKNPPFCVDLAAIEGDGSFQCPKCGLTISPEDETEQNYTIEDSKVINGELAELVIMCGKCRSTIEITGFMSEL